MQPHEAVEYVLPLLNSLGTDPGARVRTLHYAAILISISHILEESVKEAFVGELVPTMWWFFNVSHVSLVLTCVPSDM